MTNTPAADGTPRTSFDIAMEHGNWNSLRDAVAAWDDLLDYTVKKERELAAANRRIEELEKEAGEQINAVPQEHGTGATSPKEIAASESSAPAGAAPVAELIPDKPHIAALKHALKRMYEVGYDSTCDAIEDTLSYLEQLETENCTYREAWSKACQEREEANSRLHEVAVACQRAEAQREIANKKGHDAVLLAMKYEDSAKRAQAEVSRGVEVCRRDAQRWRMAKEFHPLLRLEHWDGHGWGPLYGDDADKIVDDLILKAKP